MINCVKNRPLLFTWFCFSVHCSMLLLPLQSSLGKRLLYLPVMSAISVCGAGAGRTPSLCCSCRFRDACCFQLAVQYDILMWWHYCFCQCNGGRPWLYLVWQYCCGGNIMAVGQGGRAGRSSIPPASGRGEARRCGSAGALRKTATDPGQATGATFVGIP